MNEKIVGMPALEKRVAEGWQFEVEYFPFAKQHRARIWRSHTGNSHNHAGKTEMEAIEGLERYIQSPAAAKWDEEQSPSRTGGEP